MLSLVSLLYVSSTVQLNVSTFFRSFIFITRVDAFSPFMITWFLLHVKVMSCWGVQLKVTSGEGLSFVGQLIVTVGLGTLAVKRQKLDFFFQKWHLPSLEMFSAARSVCFKGNKSTTCKRVMWCVLMATLHTRLLPTGVLGHTQSIGLMHNTVYRSNA